MLRLHVHLDVCYQYYSRSVTGVTIPNEVNFHLIGLSGKSYIRSSPENWRTLQKESRTDWKMQTLNEIIKSLNHTNVSN
jgi:hypothetical protein